MAGEGNVGEGIFIGGDNRVNHTPCGELDDINMSILAADKHLQACRERENRPRLRTLPSSVMYGGFIMISLAVFGSC